MSDCTCPRVDGYRIRRMTCERHGERMCECDRPDERGNPHSHTFDVACVYWIAGRPDARARHAAWNGDLVITDAQRRAGGVPDPTWGQS